MQIESGLVDLRERIGRLLAQLDDAFLERQTHSRLALLSLLSGHHMLMLGPPGTAKSLLARAACQCVQGGRYFEYLLSRFTHPDELFGPVSIPGLKEEDYRRLTEGYLPDAQVVFLDEVFKANSAILNSLLTLINERVFHHGTHRDPVPLLALLGASNEPPGADALEALYDRFLVRVAVRPLSQPDSFLQVCLGDVPTFSPVDADRLDLQDIAMVRAAARRVSAGEAVRAALIRIRAALQEEEIPASDRRWRWALELIRVAALTSGRDEIVAVDLLLLQYCFGTPFDTDARVQRRICREIVTCVHPLFDPAYPRQVAALLRRPLEDGVGFSAERDRRLAAIAEYRDRLAALDQGLDMRGSSFLQDAGDALWLSEVPPEVFTAILVARKAVQEAMLPLQEPIERYHARLMAASPVEGFFGAFALHSQLQSVFQQPRTGGLDRVAWLTAAGQRALLTRDGQLLMEEAPEAGPALPVLEVDADLLFAIGHAPDWKGVVQGWLARNGSLSEGDALVVHRLMAQYRRAGPEGFPVLQEEPPEDEGR